MLSAGLLAREGSQDRPASQAHNLEGTKKHARRWTFLGAGTGVAVAPSSAMLAGISGLRQCTSNLVLSNAGWLFRFTSMHIRRSHTCASPLSPTVFQ